MYLVWRLVTLHKFNLLWLHSTENLCLYISLILELLCNCRFVILLFSKLLVAERSKYYYSVVVNNSYSFEEQQISFLYSGLNFYESFWGVWSLNSLSVCENMLIYAFGNLSVMLLSDLFYSSTCFLTQCCPYFFKEVKLNVSLVVKQIHNLTEAVAWLQLWNDFMSHSWNDLQIFHEVFLKWNLCESYWSSS